MYERIPFTAHKTATNRRFWIASHPGTGVNWVFWSYASLVDFCRSLLY